MKRSQAELNSYLEAIVNKTFAQMPDERAELVSNDEREQVMKIYRSDGGYDVYRREPGKPWEEPVSYAFELWRKKAR